MRSLTYSLIECSNTDLFLDKSKNDKSCAFPLLFVLLSSYHNLYLTPSILRFPFTLLRFHLPTLYRRT